MIFVSRFVLGALFIYASWDKIVDPLSFARIIHNYRFMPPSLINLASLIIPWIEFLAGAFLIVGFRVKGAGLVLSGLLFIYAALLAVTMARGIDVSCGCFTTSMAAKSNLGLRILEDIGMLVLGTHIMLFHGKAFRVLH